jgi:repressor LexA
MPITPKQVRILHFISGYIQSNKLAPTIAEIGKHFGMRSSASVHQVLVALERNGLIKRIPNISRGIQIVEDCHANGNYNEQAASVSNGQGTTH